MHKVIILTASVLLAFVVSQATAICCGRGKHYYCNDCSKVYGALSLYTPKCCYAGSSYNSCNILCCGCKQCKKGHPVIAFASGWWYKAKYSCKQHYGDAGEQSFDEDLTDTWKAFNELDKDADGVIAPDEFLHGLRAHLGADNGDLVASDLLQSNDRSVASDFADAVSNDEATDRDLDDFGQMAYREFLKMDTDGDGLIQAAEFDGDLA